MLKFLKYSLCHRLKTKTHYDKGHNDPSLEHMIMGTLKRQKIKMTFEIRNEILFG